MLFFHPFPPSYDVNCHCLCHLLCLNHGVWGVNLQDTNRQTGRQTKRQVGLACFIKKNLEKSFDFTLIAKQPEGDEPQFTEPLQAVEVKEGDATKLHCTVTAEPPPTFEWLKDGVRVKESRRVKVDSDGMTSSLSFKDARPDDKGEYKCVASNAFGSASCAAALKVMVLSKPDFKEKLGGVEVVEGDCASFDVVVVGYPEPFVEWYRGTIKLQNDERTEIKEVKDLARFSLTIKDVSRDDAGIYKCVASNEAGKTTVRGELSVKERLFAPEIPEGQEEAPITVTEGDDCNLNTTIVGKPKPDVKWYKDDKPLRESTRLDIKARGDKHSVVILGIQTNDSGVYKCEAKSKMGTATRKFDVRVRGMLPLFLESLTFFASGNPCN